MTNPVIDRINESHISAMEKELLIKTGSILNCEAGRDFIQMLKKYYVDVEILPSKLSEKEIMEVLGMRRMVMMIEHWLETYIKNMY